MNCRKERDTFSIIVMKTRNFKMTREKGKGFVVNLPIPKKNEFMMEDTLKKG